MVSRSDYIVNKLSITWYLDELCWATGQLVLYVGMFRLREVGNLHE